MFWTKSYHLYLICINRLHIVAYSSLFLISNAEPTITIGTKQIPRSRVMPMCESSYLNDERDTHGSHAALLGELMDQGYVILRGVIDEEIVENARKAVIKMLSDKGAVRKHGKRRIDEGFIESQSEWDRKNGIISKRGNAEKRVKGEG